MHGTESGPKQDAPGFILYWKESDLGHIATISWDLKYTIWREDINEFLEDLLCCSRLVAQLCWTLFDLRDCSLPGTSVCMIYKSMYDLKSMIYFTRSIQSEDLDSGDTM